MSEELYTYDEVEAIKADIANGRPVMCKQCGTPLVFRLPGSGYHPGIFCENNCTEILMEMRPRLPQDE